MQITVKDESAVKKTLHIEIPAETVNRELDDTYRELKKTAKVKGFRPGKAPVSILKRMYRDKVNADVAFQLIQSSFPDAVQEKKLSVVGEPVISSSELKEEQPFTYDVTIEIKPELPELDYKGLKLKKNIYRCSDEDVNSQLAMLRKSMAEQKDIDPPRPASENDIAVIDFSGSHEGAEFDGFPERKDYRFRIGEGVITKSFDDHIIGMVPGDVKEFDIDFPDDYVNSQTAGKKIHFNVTLLSLKEEVLPALDDALAKVAGPYESLEKLREAIKSNIQSGYDKRSEQELSEQILEALLSKYVFKAPESIINLELNGILEEIERTYKAYKMPLESMGQTREALAEKYRNTAEKQAKRHILLNKIIEQDNLDITEDDLENGFSEIAASLNQPVDTIRQFYRTKPDQLDVLKYSFLEKKAMQKMIDSSDIEEIFPEKPGDDKTEE